MPVPWQDSEHWKSKKLQIKVTIRGKYMVLNLVCLPGLLIWFFCKLNFAASPHIHAECRDWTQRHTCMTHINNYGSARAALKHLETSEFERHSSKHLRILKDLESWRTTYSLNYQVYQFIIVYLIARCNGHFLMHFRMTKKFWGLWNFAGSGAPNAWNTSCRCPATVHLELLRLPRWRI